MSVVQIVRYPNRRLYARAEGRYVALEDIERLVRQGETVEIRDSQTDEDITRGVLTRIILDRHPDKMRLFPVAMLHAILRSNEVMADFLRDYFRHSLTYLDFLQRHAPTNTLARPMHWVKAWLDGFVPSPASETARLGEGGSAAHPENPTPEIEPYETVPAASVTQGNVTADAVPLAARIAELEARLRQLEAARTGKPPSATGRGDAGNH